MNIRKKRKNYKEKKQMIHNFNKLTNQEQESFAKLNNIPVPQVISALQESCYLIDNLSITELKSFRKDLDSMGQEDIKIVEHINNMPYDQILKSLDDEIAEYDAIAKKKRAFNQAWKIRKREVIQQLINEGKIQVNKHYMMTDIFLIKELQKAQQELLKEYGL